MSYTQEQDQEQELDYSYDDHDEDEEDVDATTLLTLACQHDRVDIVKTLLEANPMLLNPASLDWDGNKNDHLDGSMNDNSREKGLPVVSVVPPLHCAIAHGSVRVVNCLLRLGADPTLMVTQSSSSSLLQMGSDSDGNNDNSMQKYYDKTAYDIAFGKKAVNLAPGKLQGIQHAFEAEVLRAIGSDEVHRVFQLLISGLSKDTCVGDMMLSQWAVTLNAPKCRKLVNAEGVEFYGCKLSIEEVLELESKENDEVEATKQESQEQLSRSIMLQTSVSVEQMLEENEALAQMLSESVDELAAEVAMSNQFLLAGGNALLEEVRKLKAKKAQLEIELDYYNRQWVENKEELQYLQRCFPKLVEERINEHAQLKASEKVLSIDENEKKRRITAEGLLKASQDKVRKLRACIADLAEENSRNLAEIDRLGRFGTVNFARKLQGEVRDVEYAVIDAKANCSKCKSLLTAFNEKIEVFQSKVKNNKTNENPAITDADANGYVGNSSTSSESILAGQSKAITRRPEKTAFGSYDFWVDLFYRIFGLGKAAIKRANPLNSGKAILV